MVIIEQIAWPRSRTWLYWEEGLVGTVNPI